MNVWYEFTCAKCGRRDLERELRGALRAADERLAAAAARVGLPFGCDAADHMADEILSLRAEVEQLRASPCDLSRRHWHCLHCGHLSPTPVDCPDCGANDWGDANAPWPTRDQQAAARLALATQRRSR